MDLDPLYELFRKMEGAFEFDDRLDEADRARQKAHRFIDDYYEQLRKNWRDWHETHGG